MDNTDFALQSRPNVYRLISCKLKLPSEEILGQILCFIICKCVTSFKRAQHKQDGNLGFLCVQDDSVVFGLEPLHGLVLDKSVGESDGSDLSASVSHVHASPAQDDVEVHTVDTDGGVVLDTQVDVLLDSESEVSVVGEVLTTQLVLADLERNKNI